MSKKFDFLKKVPAPEPAGRSEGARKRAAVAGTPRRRGRPPGKRSDPDFEQVTVYMRRKTHQEAKMALLKEGKRRQFSDIVDELVGKWVAGQK